MRNGSLSQQFKFTPSHTTLLGSTKARYAGLIFVKHILRTLKRDKKLYITVITCLITPYIPGKNIRLDDTSYCRPRGVIEFNLTLRNHT